MLLVQVESSKVWCSGMLPRIHIGPVLTAVGWKVSHITTLMMTRNHKVAAEETWTIQP